MGGFYRKKDAITFLNDIIIILKSKINNCHRHIFLNKWVCTRVCIFFFFALVCECVSVYVCVGDSGKENFYYS